MKPVSRQPCTGLIFDCEQLEAEADRQKKGVVSSDDAHDDNDVENQGTGWLKLDSGILKPPIIPDSHPERSSTPESEEANNSLEPVVVIPVIPSEPT
jgi:hypothetical protein